MKHVLTFKSGLTATLEEGRWSCEDAMMLTMLEVLSKGRDAEEHQPEPWRWLADYVATLSEATVESFGQDEQDLQDGQDEDGRPLIH